MSNLNKKKFFVFIFVFFLFTGFILSIYLKYFADFPIEIRRLARILKSNPYVYVDNYDHTVHFQSDSLKIVGTLYGDEQKGLNPSIILLHGSSSYGRKLALYRIFGREFARRGYITLCLDFRGFGDSEDPSFDNPKMFDFCQDVTQAINFMLSKDNVDSSKIYLVGHSLGGSAAFVVGARDKRIQKVVAIGPSRRVKERVLPALEQTILEGTQYIDAHQYRVSRDMRLEGTIPLKVIEESIISMIIDNYVDYYAQRVHKPILLIDGELENNYDKMYLKKLYEHLTPPCRYITFENVAHYHNTINWAGKALILYDPQAIDELVAFIDQWFRSSND